MKFIILIMIFNFLMIFIHDIYKFIPTYRLTLSDYPTHETIHQIGVALKIQYIALYNRKAYENMATGPTQRDRAMLKLNIEAGEIFIRVYIYDALSCIKNILIYTSDLTSLFDWNTKQLFVMLIAHYKTNRNVCNHDSCPVSP